MKNIIQICVEGNTGSTGRIAEGIGQLVIQAGWNSYIAHGRFPRDSSSEIIKIGNLFDVVLHGLQTRFFDRHCFGSIRATKKLLNLLERIQPDIIHLHHLHGYYINMVYLFNYLSFTKIPVVWTFHDCWSFTGHCAYFDFVACNRWEKECHNCPQKHEYPASWLIDRSNRNYHLKSKIFNSLDTLVIVPVSTWLNDLIDKSFLKRVPKKIIYNGIDTNTFVPDLNDKNIRRKYNIDNKFMILGVASPWSRRKGLQDFIQLSKLLKTDMIIVLVGLTKNQIHGLPKNIIALERTENQKHLNDLYATADVFVNPTWEDNFPTTNIESLACGTPVITYNTGGSVEAISCTTGIIVKKGDIGMLLEAILKVKSNGKMSYTNQCRERAILYYNKEERFAEYISLYNTLLTKGSLHK